MKKPNFILLDNNHTLKSIEDILIEFNHPMFKFTGPGEIKEKSKQLLSSTVKLDGLASINDDEFRELFTLIGRFDNLDKVVSSIQMSTTTAGTISYNYDATFPEVRGPSQINSINYQLYFLLKFYVHKDAFVNILKYDVKTDEFGKSDLSKWQKKFGTFFVEHLFDLSLVTDGKDFLKIKEHFLENTSWSPKREKYKKFEYMASIFQSVESLYLCLAKKYFDYKPTTRPTSTSTHEKGLNLEMECKEILESNSWSVQTTPKSNDQGADLIAQKGLIKLIIQCKNYDKPVGNDAVQQALAAKTFFGGTIAAVVSVSGFTMSALELSKKTEVLLMNLSDLSEI